MFKVITKLTHDLKAEAGQLLILHDNGKVYAVDQSKVENIFISSIINDKSSESSNFSQIALTYQQRKDQVADMLYRGRTLSEICAATGFARVTIARQRSKMIKDGFLQIDNPRAIKGHYWFKSPEALEKARQRGRMLGKRKTK